MFPGTDDEPCRKTFYHKRTNERVRMADASSKDPSAVWRDLVSQWEKGFNTLANQTMASDEFSNSANQSMSLALKLQQATATTMASYLATLNLPSRADVTALGERLHAMEGYLSRIAVALESAPPAAAKTAPRSVRARTTKPAKPPRTKQPPSFEKT
jgi:hypothetical protein